MSIRRRDRRFNLRMAGEDLRHVRDDFSPQLGPVRLSAKSIQKIDQGLQTSFSVSCHVFEVRGYLGELARPQIIRMTFPRTPDTYLGLLFEAMLSGGGDDTLALSLIAYPWGRNPRCTNA